MKHHQAYLHILTAVVGFILSMTTTSTSEKCHQFFCKDAKIITSFSFRKYLEVNEILLQKLELVNHGKWCRNSMVSENLGLSIVLSKEKNISSLSEKFSTGKQIRWLGICGGDIVIALATNNIDCFEDNLHLKDSLQDINLNLLKIPLRYELFQFSKGMIDHFYELISSNDKIKMKKHLERIFNKLDKKCRLINYETFKTNIVDSSSTASDSINWVIENSSSVIEFNSTTDQGNMTEKPPLTKHSHHGDIPYLIITLVCTLCGGSCLSFLLCFRRTRHMICSCCNLCRDVNRYSRLFDDP